jgi:hypothetical protein
MDRRRPKSGPSANRQVRELMPQAVTHTGDEMETPEVDLGGMGA